MTTAPAPGPWAQKPARYRDERRGRRPDRPRSGRSGASGDITEEREDEGGDEPGPSGHEIQRRRERATAAPASARSVAGLHTYSSRRCRRAGATQSPTAANPATASATTVRAVTAAFPGARRVAPRPAGGRASPRSGGRTGSRRPRGLCGPWHSHTPAPCESNAHRQPSRGPGGVDPATGRCDDAPVGGSPGGGRERGRP